MSKNVKTDEITRIIEALRKASSENQFYHKIKPRGHDPEMEILTEELNNLFSIVDTGNKIKLQAEKELEDLKDRYQRLNADVSMYQEKESELNKVLATLSRSQEIAKVGNWDWNVKTGDVTWSEQVYHIFGLTPGESPKKIESIMEMFHPEERKLHEKLVMEAARDHRKYTFDSRIILPDGGMKFLRSTSEGNYDEHGDLLKLTGIVQDITDYKQAEINLDRSERLFNNIFDQSPHPIWISDNKGTLIKINKACLELLQIKENEVQGKYNVLKDNIVMEQGFLPLVTSVYEEGKTVNFMLRYDSSRLSQLKLKRTTNTLLDVTMSPVRNISGDITHAVITHRDVTSVKKAEEDLRRAKDYAERLIESANAMIVVLDPSGNINVFNRAAEEITGYKRQEILGRNWFDTLVPEDKKSEPWGKFRNASLIGMPPSFEGPIVSKTGEERFLSFRNTELREDHAVTGLLFYGIDVTERKRLEEQLIQSRKMEAIGQLAGGIAHDFNNMLSVILGHAELIKSELPDGHPILKSILAIEKAGIHSRDITRQLLAFSRKQIIVPGNLNVNNLILNIQKTLSQLIGEDIEFRFVPGTELWNIKFDPSQIDQILINLVINARDAMPTGGILTIETSNITLDETYCALHMESTPGEYVLLTVSDNGMGMDKEVLSHIYEPFFTTKELGKGTGLGLATVYGIVKQNNCLINVYSEKERGTTFKIYFPRISTTEKGGAHDVEAPLRFRTGTIMLVEDDALVRDMVIMVLQKIGYTVTTAKTPREAVSFFARGGTRIDLLITDIVMPHLNGTELYQKVKMIDSNVKVLYMSGYTENVIVRHGVLKEGINFIQKPFSMKEFAQKVREAMEDK